MNSAVSLGEVDVITARLLLVDPSWLAADVVNELSAHGQGIVIDMGNDGSYQVYRNADGSHTIG